MTNRPKRTRDVRGAYVTLRYLSSTLVRPHAACGRERKMFTLSRMGILLAIIGAAHGQSNPNKVKASTTAKDREETAIRTQLAYGFEETWNSHQPAAAVTADKCIEDAVFINTSGGWVKG